MMPSPQWQPAANLARRCCRAAAEPAFPAKCCNVAVILDFSKYMRRIVSIDYDNLRARVEPGVVLDILRAEAERHELTFAPDPATHNRCTIGGMIGNNSCGVHALMGGKTVDNIESLDVLLYDGTRMTLGPMSEDALEAAIARGGRAGEIYAGLKRIRDNYATLVRERFPDIPRRVSGYNLDQLLPENGFHVARALVGTEATCVTVLEATVRLMKSPQHRQLVVLGFADAFVAADAVPEILKYKPIGLEGFDSLLVDFLRRKQMALEEIELLPNGRGFLLVEFGADSEDEARDQAEHFIREVEGWPTPPQAKRVDGEQAERVWRVRESALGAVTFVPGVPELWEGWEDSAVPPENLGTYLRETPGTGRRVRLHHADLRALRAGLHPHAHQLRHALGGRRKGVSRVHRSRSRPRARAGRFALRRTRRWPVARRAAAKDVRSGADAGLP